MANASGRDFDNGELIDSIAHAIVAREWNALADEVITMGPRPKWWRLCARRRWDRTSRRIINHWQIWRDAHRESA